MINDPIRKINSQLVIHVQSIRNFSKIGERLDPEQGRDRPKISLRQRINDERGADPHER